MKNEALKAYKTLKAARIARAYYTRKNRAVSAIFKTELSDKRLKNKARYALILDAKRVIQYELSYLYQA